MKGRPDGKCGGKARGQLGEGRNLGANFAEIAAAARGVSAALKRKVRPVMRALWCLMLVAHSYFTPECALASSGRRAV
jgi:hypothetical protein